MDPPNTESEQARFRGDDVLMGFTSNSDIWFGCSKAKLSELFNLNVSTILGLDNFNLKPGT